jgi:hypothetical protein
MSLAVYIGIGMGVMLATIIAVGLGPVALSYFRAQRIAASGIAATAEVIDLADSGNRINHQPVANVRMTVTPPGGAPYQATSQTIVSGINSPWYQPGKRILVKLDPAHPERVTIMGPAP